MIIAGLDTVAMIFLMLAVAMALGYILTKGINVEFTKSQFFYVVFALILFGMFLMAWLRETGDELLILITLVVVSILLTIKRRIFGRKKR
jgi:hypothetical protein